ncbi:hypothetical protein DLAC_10328 [Tieghemostelium lacteum]|uniref:J domain-containing protein n=1 Tax=Tieghemostelium lacteum TaxID=361077 RepID=A0A151Z5B0_TIELA|nr:hypothetical protein DLAC_10328 [Tieghemostelium lacteum]|eukprot:KYQ89097.1 hypothetical protein DLAC_10328 [Tieghemostelium lacteum]
MSSQQKAAGDSYKKERASSTDYKDIEFQFWLILFLTIVLVPCLIWLYRRFKSKPVSELNCKCDGCLFKDKEKQKVHQAERNSISSKIKIGLVILLSLFYIYLIYSVSTTSITEKEPYNPYKLLDLEDGATPDEIKKAYRKLSLKYHPDKNPGKEAQDKFIAISKAYEALTDDAVREKYEKYGNPDGPQPISVGIALPSWLINKSNSSLVLAGYMLLLILIGIAVYYYVKSTRKNATIPISQQTLAFYYHTVDNTFRLKSLIEMLAAAIEFKDLPERISDEDGIKSIIKHIPSDYKIKKGRYNAKFVVKGTHLLYAHISRMHNTLSETLREDLRVILGKYRMILNAYFQLSKDKRQLGPMVEIIHLLQCVTQAAWEDQQLKQLPHFDSYLIDTFHRKYKIHDLLKMKQVGQEKRLEYFNDQGLSETAVKDIEYVLNKIPSQIGVNYKFTCDDESSVLYTTSLLNLEIEFYDKTQSKPKSIRSPTSSATSPVVLNKSSKKSSKKTSTKKSANTNTNEESDEDLDEEEEKREKKSKKDDDSDLSDGDLDVSDSDSDSDWEPVPKKKLTETNEKEVSHSPFTLDDKPTNWFIFLGDRQKGDIIAFGASNSSEPGKSISLKFLSSQTPGVHHYNLYVMCDSYLGCDYEHNVTLKLAPNPNPNPELVRHQEQQLRQKQSQQANTQNLSKKEERALKNKNKLEQIAQRQQQQQEQKLQQQQQQEQEQQQQQQGNSSSKKSKSK